MLELLYTKTDFFTYRGCGGYTGGTTLCTPSVIYGESITIGVGRPVWFYYSEILDRFMLMAIVKVENAQGAEYNIYTIHPETGDLTRTFNGVTGGVGFSNQLNSQAAVANGAQGRLYAYRTVFGGGKAVMAISRQDYPFYNDYELANPLITTTDIPDLDISNDIGPIVSWLNDMYLQVGPGGVAGISGSDNALEVYSISTGNLLHRAWLPEVFPLGTAWEDDERVWMLCAETSSNSTRQAVLKYNYKHNIVEHLTELQRDATTDVYARLAYDTRRKKIGVIRFKADSANGKHNNMFQIYAPQPLMSALTIPVGIDIKKPSGGRSHFITSLRGTKGESGSSRLVTVSKTGTGSLGQNEVYTKDGGLATIEYIGGTAAGSVTITAEHIESRSS